ncbi:hypothetical protein TEA_011016 [Camellia sinensis var. sinensis]|uniref:NAD(P)-binding domain-containing protein n=1 Tax=Camellia sinensis var. sinensis TaxID=542762 RepID=A0A4S4DZP5_CAMSN|nr:hypothetical protein TEA_011016 [Camellia sinensis var. sinensis]
MLCGAKCYTIVGVTSRIRTSHLLNPYLCPVRTKMLCGVKYYTIVGATSKIRTSHLLNPYLCSDCHFYAPNDAMDASSPGLVGANDLLIVGPGVLGRLVAQKWREEHPGCQIFGQTVTTDHHDELIKIGINPSLKETKATHKFPYVVFCAPPSRTPDYPGDVREAVSSWSGEGSFLFTSSSAPYDCNDNGSCDEDSPVVPTGRSPRTDVLLKAEKAVLESGGSVVRLAGLYISFMKMQVMRFTYVYWCNFWDLWQQIMDLVNKSGKFSKKFESFTGTSDPLGKKLNNMKTSEELRWEPKYPSFAQFLGVSL